MKSIKTTQKQFNFDKEWSQFIAGMEKLRKSQEKTEEQIQELKEFIKKNEEKVARIGYDFGNLQNNLGEITEEFFYDGLKTHKQLGKLRFDTVAQRVRDFDHNEYDIVLQNGNAVAVIEVKQKVHPKSVDKLVRQIIPRFKKSYEKIIGDQKVYAGIAGFSVPEDVRKKAEKLGLFVLTQSGDDMKVANSKQFQARAY